MDALKSKILDLLDQHRLMTIATNRPDGWPQATTVGYVNDGLTIYFLCSPQSQKAANLARDNRVSLTIDNDVTDPMAITGLSMAAQAQPVTNPTEIAKAMNLLVTRYPEYAAFPMPKPEEITVYRVVPKVISVLDYSKGFGHSDLVTISASGGSLRFLSLAVIPPTLARLGTYRIPPAECLPLLWLRPNRKLARPASCSLDRSAAQRSDRLLRVEA
jgi:nitroimidazol reductase NimA-like FMN-containing flavoprotein (pyridoxamine 5'-phosphate oxidase superfamily)